MTGNSRQIPFVGLRPFDSADHQWFHGRDREIATLLRKVRNNRFTAVVGASGSGKSSLVRAGILPPLTTEGWKAIIVKPGSAPIAKLALALSSASTDTTDDPLVKARLYWHDNKLRQSAFGLAEISRQLAPDAQRLLLVVDQFEELFRYGEEAQDMEKAAMEEESRAFVELLLTAASQNASRLHVMITMRSDFFGNCAAYAGLAEAVSASQYLVPLPRRDQLEEIIRAPVADTGGKMDEMLVQRLLLDVMEQIDHLPTLQHTLRRLWEVAQGEPRWLREQDYAAIGGMAGSIDVKAEQIVTVLQRAHKEDFITLERLMKAITALDEQGRTTRRPQKRSALLALVTEVLGDDKAADASLNRVLNALTSEDISFIQLGAGDDPEVDIGHEALIRSWRRLCGEDRHFKTGWLADEREDGRRWWDLVQRSKSRRLLHLSDVLHTRHWLKKNKIGSRWCDRYGDAWETIQQFLQNSLIRKGALALSIFSTVTLIVIISIVFAWANYQEKLRQEAETLRQARAGALAAAGYAQSFIDNGDTRLGALIALSVTPESRRSDDPSYVHEVGATLANALTRPIEIMRRRHNSEVLSVAFSPDGSRIVSSSVDNTLRLWDAHTGEAIGEPLSGQRSWVSTIAFSPDSSRIVSVSSDDLTLRRWDTNTAAAIGKPLHGHESWVTSAAFSPDGSRIVSGSLDSTLRLWDANTGAPIGKPLRGHKSRVTSVAFSPDGSRIVSSGEDKTLRLWDTHTGTAIGEPLRGHKNWISSVAFSLDGNRIISGSEGKMLRLWDAHTGAAIGKPLHGTASNIVFSPDGRRIVSSSSDKTLRLWDINTGEAIGEPLRGHESQITSIAFSPNGNRIVSGSSDKTLRLWNTLNNKAIGQPLYGHKNQVTSIAFSPDGNRIVSGSDDKTIRIWDVRSGAGIGKPLRGHKNWINTVAFSPDGNRIVSGSRDDTLRLWNANTGTAIGGPLYGHYDSVYSVAFSPDGNRIVSGSASYFHALLLWDFKTGIAIGDPLGGHGHYITSVAFSPDGSRIVSGSKDNTLRLWDADTGRPIGEPLRGHKNQVMSIAFSPNGSRIVSGSKDYTLRLWDANTGTTIGEPLRGHKNWINSVAFSPDGSRIVSGSTDNTLRQWDAKTGETIGEPLHGHSNSIYSVDFSPDGSRIVSSSDDKTVRLWDANTGTAIGEPLHGHGSSVTSVAFSPDGSRIVSGSEDQTLRQWDVRIFTASLKELADRAEKLCPLSLAERRQLHLVDPEAEAKAKPLTPDQRRACGD